MEQKMGIEQMWYQGRVTDDDLIITMTPVLKWCVEQMSALLEMLGVPLQDVNSTNLSAMLVTVSIVAVTAIWYFLARRPLASFLQRKYPKEGWSDKIVNLQLLYVLFVMLAFVLTYLHTSNIILTLVMALCGVLVVIRLEDYNESNPLRIWYLLRTFKVGDKISFGGIKGELLEKRLFCVVLRTLSGDEVTAFASTNMRVSRITSMNVPAISVIVYLSQPAELEKAREALEKAAPTFKGVTVKKPDGKMMYSSVNDGMAMLELTFGCKGIRSEKAYVAMEREVKEDIRRTLDDAWVRSLAEIAVVDELK